MLMIRNILECKPSLDMSHYLIRRLSTSLKNVQVIKQILSSKTLSNMVCMQAIMDPEHLKRWTKFLWIKANGKPTNTLIMLLLRISIILNMLEVLDQLKNTWTTA